LTGRRLQLDWNYVEVGMFRTHNAEETLMNRHSLICIALGLVISAGASESSAVMINFESLPTGALAGNGLAAYRIVSITTSGGTGAQIYDYGSGSDIQAPSPTKVFLPSGGLFPNPNGFFDTTLTFDTEMEYFRFSKIAEVAAPFTYGIAGWRARAFDGSNGLVAEVQKNLNGGLDFPSPLPNQTFLLQGANGIKKVVFTVNYNFQSTSGTVGLDNFEFRVPEPTSLVLFGLGTVLLLSWKGRKSPA
jgi:hypothetical protein